MTTKSIVKQLQYFAYILKVALITTVLGEHKGVCCYLWAHKIFLPLFKALHFQFVVYEMILNTFRLPIWLPHFELVTGICCCLEGFGWNLIYRTLIYLSLVTELWYTLSYIWSILTYWALSAVNHTM